jgi:hypothetical protein
MPKFSSTIALSLTAILAALAACSSGEEAAPASPPQALEPSTDPLPTETSPPTVYVAKVKNILVGLPPTDEEIKAVEADPAKLASLIDGWMKLPQYEAKLVRFFQLAFQQTQVDEVDFDDQSFPTKISINRATTPLVIQNATESFARTVVQLTSQGHPLTEAMTTHTLMMTPGLMEMYAWLDAWQVDDAGKVTDRFKVDNPNAVITVTSSGGPIPAEDSADPTSPNYLHYYNPDLATYDKASPGCFVDPVVYDKTNTNTPGLVLQRVLQGSLDGRKNPLGGKACPNVQGATALQMAGDDYTTWKMVTVRTPKAGEKATDFYDLPKLRSATELVLRVPRVGFFSTPAFFANWATNTSNQMRVTMNQALIVGLGAQVDGTDAMHPASTPGLDATHAGAPACLACHQTLDPTRSVFSANFSWNYHVQTDTALTSQPGMFQFQGVTKPVTSLDDFGNALATHPLFPQAWAQKLCYYANSRKCDAMDPEFQRVVDAFKTSGFSWNVLVRELLSSAITTNAKPTKTLADQGEVVAVARRDHLCTALNVRLGFSDVCGLQTQPAGKGKQVAATIQELVSGLPSDGYGRGSTAPVLPNEPSLFFRAATENICASVAQLVVDPAVKQEPTAKQWASTDPDAAIADFVHTLMALTASDARSPLAIAALKAHFSAAVQSGASASDALKSTFVVACLAPSAISVGL